VRKINYILLLVTTMFFSCEPNHLERIYIDEELRYFVEEWAYECEKYGIDYNKGLAHLDTIKYSEFKYLHKLGEHSIEKREILISTEVQKENHYFQRLIVFHELGHALRLPHTCGKLSIMNPLLSHTHIEHYNLWWKELMSHYFIDTVLCRENAITRDSIDVWIERYEGYCNYSNSMIGPR